MYKKFLYPIVKCKKLKSWIKYWILSIPEKAKGIWSEILTGTSFTLENSLESVFNVFDLKGNTSQDSTNGYQLLPFTNQDFTVNGVRYYVENGELYLDGTSQGETPTTNSNFKNNFSFTLEAGTYIFSKAISSVPLRISKKADNTEIMLNTSSTLTQTFTLSEETEVYFGLYIYDKTFTKQSYSFMLEKGSTAHTWEKYTRRNSFT